jgi:hypothetical protein
MAITDFKKTYIFARDGHVCQYCNCEPKSWSLQGHHLRPVSRGGTNDTKNLITVCKHCHELINQGYTMLNHRSTERVYPQYLKAGDIELVWGMVKKLLLGEIKDIALAMRQGKMWMPGKTFFIDSAAKAYIAIEKTLGKAMRALIPFSLVINKADFDELSVRCRAMLHNDMEHRRYTWVIDPLDGVKAFRTAGNGNYCINVVLYIGTTPVMRLAFYPEYELEGAAGVIFESNETKEIMAEKSEEIHKKCVEK